MRNRPHTRQSVSGIASLAGSRFDQARRSWIAQRSPSLPVPFPWRSFSAERYSGVTNFGISVVVMVSPCSYGGSPSLLPSRKLPAPNAIVHELERARRAHVAAERTPVERRLPVFRLTRREKLPRVRVAHDRVEHPKAEVFDPRHGAAVVERNHGRVAELARPHAGIDEQPTALVL